MIQREKKSITVTKYQRTPPTRSLLQSLPHIWFLCQTS
jgi:hypothetical protein